MLLASLMGAAPALAERVELPVAHLDGRPLSALFYAPQSAAATRRPAVVMLHGCGGVGAHDEPNARHRMWADTLLERGYAVLFPLSFSSRGLVQVCTVPNGSRTVRPADRVADVLAAQAWLAGRRISMRLRSRYGAFRMAAAPPWPR